MCLVQSYRPLTVLTFRWNHSLHGMDPFGFHLVNLLIHVANRLVPCVCAVVTCRDGSAVCCLCMRLGGCCVVRRRW